MAGSQSAGGELSDEALAARVRAHGDTAAYGELIDRYRARLLALTRRMLGGSQEEAEDVVQEAFVAAYHRRATYRQGDAFRPWLYRIAINKCVDRLRARSRKPPAASLSDAPEEAAAGGEPLNSLLAAEREERLQRAVEELPPKYRAVFLLRHLDDLSYEDIARATELPLGTVKTHLFRARAQLREALQGYLEP
jgi:RNA polymerase sigma-70 factor (ECF subfamily)